MRFVRAEMRAHRQALLTVPQFRALVFVSYHEHSSVTALAEHLGLSLPAASRMVEILVQRGFVRRSARAGDRRCVRLSLTRRGAAAFHTAHHATQAALVRRFRALTESDLAVVTRAMAILGRLFAAKDCGRVTGSVVCACHASADGGKL